MWGFAPLQVSGLVWRPEVNSTYHLPTPVFTWILGIRTQALTLAQQALLSTGQLSSSETQFFKYAKLPFSWLYNYIKYVLRLVRKIKEPNTFRTPVAKWYWVCVCWSNHHNRGPMTEHQKNHKAPKIRCKIVQSTQRRFCGPTTQKKLKTLQ